MADSPIKILMAEDDQETRSFVSRRLRLEGMEVVEAADGAQAEELFFSQKPDVVLLDIDMPVKNGFEVLAAIRKNPIDKVWRPVILISAFGELDDYRKGYSLEADHYLTKPCKLEDIVSAIRLMAALIPLRAG